MALCASSYTASGDSLSTEHDRQGHRVQKGDVSTAQGGPRPEEGGQLGGAREGPPGNSGSARVEILPPMSHPAPSVWFSLDALARLFRARQTESESWP